MINRRMLLKSSGLISLSPLMPTFLCKLASASQTANEANGNILVVIQLDGGNDGINTVIPFADEGYTQHRKELRIPSNEYIKLTDSFAFNPRLRSASDLFNEGRLSVVHGVGYPNPNRSHFESMEIWQTGSVDQEQRLAGNGWLGQSLSGRSNTRDAHAIQIGDETLPVAIRGRRCNATTISTFSDLDLRLQDIASASSSHNGAETEDLNDFITKSVSTAYVSAKELASMTRSDASAQYPDSKLGNRLKMISQLIKTGASTQVYYTVQSGYDTHATQLGTHGGLLGELSSSLKAFMNDLRQSSLEDRVLVMTFSEFGRRVEENDSLGTDHGTAGPVLLSGNKLAARSYGDMPSLMKLVDDDLQYTTDFRDLYSAIVTDWLGLELPEYLAVFKMPGLFS